MAGSSAYLQSHPYLQGEEQMKKLKTASSVL